MNIFERFLVGIIAFLLVAVAFAQTFEAGERHAKAEAVYIQNAASYNAGFEACQEQF